MISRELLGAFSHSCSPSRWVQGPELQLRVDMCPRVFVEWFILILEPWLVLIS